MFASRRAAARGVFASALAIAATVALAGCSTISTLFGSGPAPFEQQQPTAAPAAANPATTANGLEFNSVFTDFGSIHPRVSIGPDLELELDMWTEQKTHEWYAPTEKVFSFVVNVHDNRVPEDAPFEQKRRVFMSNITVTSATSANSGVMENPFVLNADPTKITRDPEALRSEYGLLVTAPKGGLQVEGNRIGQLAADTYGLTLDFAFQLVIEGAASNIPGGGFDQHGYTSAGYNGFTTQVVHIPVPIAIFTQPLPTSTSVPTPLN